MGRFAFRGRGISFVEAGADHQETVVLHHGLLMSAQSWVDAGYVTALASRFHVLAIDSLGHGESEDVDADALLDRDGRADAVARLADHCGVKAFHFVGYSMGGWVGGQLARSHPDRLKSVSIGGWDVVSGFQTAKQWAKVKFGIDLDVDLLISLSAADPQMHEVGIASPERLDGWRRTGVLLEPEPRDLEAIDALGVPVHLWCGRGDGYHSAMHASADALGGVFDSLSGDHMTAYGRPEGPAALRRFLDSVTPPSSTASRGSVTR